MVTLRISAFISEEIGTYTLTNMVTRLIKYVYHVLHFVLVLFAQLKGKYGCILY